MFLGQGSAEFFEKNQHTTSHTQLHTATATTTTTTTTTRALLSLSLSLSLSCFVFGLFALNTKTTDSQAKKHPIGHTWGWPHTQPERQK